MLNQPTVAKEISDFQSALDFVCDLRNAGSKFSLDRIAKFVEAFGNPHLKYPVIHVAGTNGKGSVCAMLERILRAHGLKTGMFTSPHLVNLGERVQINREELSRAEILRRIQALRKVADGIFNPSERASYPSFFEYMTVLAFAAFADAKADAAVVEVGLGGRLDSTNIVRPDICAITSIGLDHTSILGDTYAQIAAEKAGIIKESVPIVCGFVPDEAFDVIKAVADEKGAPFYDVRDYFSCDASLPETSLYGKFQRRNAAVALLCAEILKERAACGKSAGVFERLDLNVAKKALKDVSWAARWQKIKLSNGATLILDSSHNEEGARTLESNLRGLGVEKPTIAVGVLGEERAVPLFKVISKYAGKILLLVPHEPRALNFEALKKCIGKCDVPILECEVGEVFKPGWNCAYAGAGETIVSTGSIYLAGEVLAALQGVSPDGLSDRI